MSVSSAKDDDEDEEKYTAPSSELQSNTDNDQSSLHSTLLPDINQPLSGAKPTPYRQRPLRSRVPSSVLRQTRRGRPPERAVSHRRGGRQPQAHETLGGEAALRAWQASQNLIGQLRSENHLLQERLRSCQLELRTVQRECKVQSARLSKAVGREADMPEMIERLNAEVRGLQERLRQKRAAADAAERRAAAAEARLAPLLMRRQQQRGETNSAGTTATADGDSADHAASRPPEPRSAEVESLKASIEFERGRLRDAQRKNEALERNHKAELSVAYEQIRKLRKINNDLQEQLANVTRNLQEKTKLLELQNIYSHRLPKSVIIQNAGFERRCGPESEGLNECTLSQDPRSRSSEVTGNRKCSPRLPAIRRESAEKRRRGCRPAVSQISTMVAKMKSGLFARAHTSSLPEAKEEKEYSQGSSFPPQEVVEVPAPRARRRKKRSPMANDDHKQVEFKEPPSEMGDLVKEETESSAQSKPQESLEPQKEAPDATVEPELPSLATEVPINLIVEKEVAEENPTPPPNPQSDPPGSEAADAAKSLELSEEDLLWKSIFGKDSLGSTNPGYLPTSKKREETGPVNQKTRPNNPVRNPLEELEAEGLLL